MNRTVCLVKENQEIVRLSKRRFWVAAIASLIIILFLSVFFISKTVTAQRRSDRNKLITSIEIKKGDTLWSIAESYITEEYHNINDYIEEIKTTNGLTSDTIYAGYYIVVPYYTDPLGSE